MSTIQIANLCPAGSELFQDSESFLYELTDHESTALSGGGIAIGTVVFGFVSIAAATIITANSNSINANTIGNNNP